MSLAQRPLPLDGPDAAPPAHAADLQRREAAWVESERGRPLHARRAVQDAAIAALFGRTFAAGIPTDDEWRDAVHADDRQRVVAALEAGRSDGGYDAHYRLVLPDGAIRPVRDRVLVLGERWQLRIVAEVESTASASPVRWLDRALDEAILRCDHAGRVVETFGPAELLPAAGADLIGRRVGDVDALPAAMRQGWTTALERAFDTQRAQISAYALDRGDGPRAFEARMLPIDGGVVVAVRDVGERDGLRERVARIARVDPVTSLGNARVLRERLIDWMQHGVEIASAVPVVLLVVDLDRFRQPNDLYGRSIGDTLLRLVAQRLAREADAGLRGRADDAGDASEATRLDAIDRAGADRLAVVRLGGDQFAVAWRVDADVTAAAAIDAAAAMAARLITALGAPTRIAGQTLFVRASIGVARYPTDALDPATLLSQAEGALKRAKQAGRNQFRLHGDDRAQVPASGPPHSEAALRTALASDQFMVVYQPKFELASSLSRLADEARAEEAGSDGAALLPGAMIAVEALVRWRTPSGALLIPQDFIPLAEASGMIGPLGDWVLRTALAEAGRFAERGGARVGVAVNVSLLQLHDRAFVHTVQGALDTYGFAPHELTLEIAETAFVDDVRLVADTVAELSALGVRLAIDHFGVGTAGLVALKSMPIDEIKIDRSFIAGAAIDAFDATIVRGLVEIAHNLGMVVTADGVERVDQIAALSQMRCDAIQGYFIGEPMTADALVAVPSLWRRSRAD